jgi:hypothetical protein
VINLESPCRPTANAFLTKSTDSYPKLNIHIKEGPFHVEDTRRSLAPKAILHGSEAALRSCEDGLQRQPQLQMMQSINQSKRKTSNVQSLTHSSHEHKALDQEATRPMMEY